MFLKSFLINRFPLYHLFFPVVFVVKKAGFVFLKFSIIQIMLNETVWCHLTRLAPQQFFQLVVTGRSLMNLFIYFYLLCLFTRLLPRWCQVLPLRRTCLLSFVGSHWWSSPSFTYWGLQRVNFQIFSFSFSLSSEILSYVETFPWPAFVSFEGII